MSSVAGLGRRAAGVPAGRYTTFGGASKYQQSLHRWCTNDPPFPLGSSEQTQSGAFISGGGREPLSLPREPLRMAQSRSSSGSHYALTAIGLGMLVLGVIMAVWNLVPGFGLSAKPHPASGHHNETEVTKGLLHRNKTFSVAYVLVGAGVLLLLFSICLTIRDRRKPRHREDDDVRIRPQPTAERPPPEDSQEDDNDSISRYYVPSYEEVVNGLYPEEPRLEAERGTRISVSLPSYESLTGLDESLPTRPSPTAAGTATGAAPRGERPPARQSSRLSKRLKPLKVRRIKSEKLHLKNLQLGGGTPPARVTIEPLTPPPQYDETPPKLPDPREGEP